MRLKLPVLLLLALVLYVSSVSSPVANADGLTEQQTVLITGANRGLGLEFARQYAADGWTVIGTARSPDRAEELKALDVEVMQLDVTDQASIDALVDSLDGRAVDMLINNAGIFPRNNEIDNLDVEAYANTLMVNTIGPARVTKALLPNLRKGGGKKIVQITSRLASIELNDSFNFYGYRESKAALNMFNKSLGRELAPEGFICLALHPGWVRTDMGGENAPLSPAESVTGMRSVIAKLTADDTGGYRAYTGDTEPW